MVLEARLRIRHHGCISEKLQGRSHAAQISADRNADLLVMHGEDEMQVEDFLEGCRRTQPMAPEVISRTPTSVVLRGQNPRNGVVANILGSGCAILWPSVWANGEESYTILAPTRERFDDALRRLAPISSVSVESLADVPTEAISVNVPLSDLTSALTERQLLVLQRAIAEGYYASPRRTSTEDLAKAFGVTRSTLEEHLRKAEQRVLMGFASVLAAQPVLAKSATRRPGRPPGITRTIGPQS
jgi:predicted DNA binding protein